MALINPIIRFVFFLLPVAVCWLAGCSGGDPVAEDEGIPIVFEASGTDTRATEITTGTIQSFRVSAVWNKGVGVSQPFMSGQIVEKNTSASWVYSPARYWPTVGSVDFFAYSPAISSGVQLFSVDDNGSAATITYAIPATYAQQEDFLVASSPRRTSGPVELQFEHALSKMVIKVRNEVSMIPLRITAVEITGLDDKGTLTVTGTDAYSWIWATGSGDTPVTYRLDMPYPFEVPTDNYGEIGSLMVLPQSAALTITLYCQVEGVPDYTLEFNPSVTFQMGEKYNLLINLTP